LTLKTFTAKQQREIIFRDINTVMLDSAMAALISAKQVGRGGRPDS
jgi:hypothetical protein